MVAMPSSVVAKRCQSTLSPLPRLHGVRYSEVSGPCSAPGRFVSPSRNQSPSLLRPAWMLKYSESLSSSGSPNLATTR